MAEVDTELCRVKQQGGSLGGYKREILTEDLSEREVKTFRCGVCEGIMKDGSISSKGEQLCACCIKGGKKSHYNAPIRDTILSLKCRCPLSTRGCDWLGTLENIENHLTTCGHVSVTCELKCKMVLKRNEMLEHVLEKCPLRKIACLHCTGKYKACEMEEHVKVCKKVEMLCELGCGVLVCRENIVSHREKDCPEEIVKCPYKKYKCEVELKRRELEQHLETNRMLHMELKLEMLENQLTAKDKEIQFLKREVQIRQEVTIKWKINIPNDEIKYTKNLSLAGYHFSLGHQTDGKKSTIYFYPIKSPGHDILDWPLRVMFQTKYTDNRRRELISPMIEIQKEDCGFFSSYKKEICSIPTDHLMDPLHGTLNLEVTIRILKNKFYNI